MSKRELDSILNEMESKRETIKERPQIPQYNGFRTEWSNYITENLDNLYN